MPFICFIALAQIKKTLNGLPWVWGQKVSGHFIRYSHGGPRNIPLGFWKLLFLNIALLD